MESLTEVQQNTFNFIKKFWEENGYSPSVQEIADNAGISIRAVYDCILLLEKKRYIKHTKYVARSIVIL